MMNAENNLNFKTNDKTKNNIINIIGKNLSNFFYSDFYLILLTLTIFLCWFFKGEIIGLAIIIIFASVYLIFKDDILPLMPLIFVVAMMFPKNVDPLTYSDAFYFFIPLPIAIIYHIIKFPKKVKFGEMFLPQLAVSIALFLGGIGSISAELYKNGLTYILLLGVAILLLYMLFYMYSNPPKNLDLKKYLSKIMLYVGILIVAEVITYYARTPEKLKQIGGAVSLGWCIGNNFSTILLLTVPACFYLAKSSKFAFLYLVIAVLEYLAIIVSWSRGATLFCAIILPLLLIALLVKSKGNLKNLIISLCVLLVIFAIFLGVYWGEIMGTVKGILAQGTGDSGRSELYAEAIQCFKENPFFGAGIGFDGDYFNINNMPMYWFHSTLFQIIGSMGIIGIIAYIYYYYARYKILFKYDNFNIFILIGMFGFEGYSMMDTGTFVPIPIMLMVILITMVVEFTNRQDYYKKLSKP